MVDPYTEMTIMMGTLLYEQLLRWTYLASLVRRFGFGFALYDRYHLFFGVGWFVTTLMIG
jgi:hypothetical protein